MDKGKLINGVRFELLLPLFWWLIYANGCLHRPNEPREYWVKVRPGARSLLTKLCRMNFTLVACTQGTATYAKQLLRVLDPTGSLFGERLIAAQDCSIERPVKTIDGVAAFVGVDPKRVLVLDDRTDVWRGLNDEATRMRIIRVKPYVWFSGYKREDAYRRVWTLKGIPSRIYTNMEFDDKTFLYLDRIGDIVVEAWHRSLGTMNGDLFPGLRLVRREIFGGMRIFLDGFESHELANECRDAGAILQTEIDESTTHIVTVRPTATAAVELALRRDNILVYTAEWLIECLYCWESLSDDRFIPEYVDRLRKAVATNNTPQASSSETRVIQPKPSAKIVSAPKTAQARPTKMKRLPVLEGMKDLPSHPVRKRKKL